MRLMNSDTNITMKFRIGSGCCQLRVLNAEAIVMEQVQFTHANASEEIPVNNTDGWKDFVIRN